MDRAVAERFVLETCMYFPFTTAKAITGFGAPPYVTIMALADRVAEGVERDLPGL